MRKYCVPPSGTKILQEEFKEIKEVVNNKLAPFIRRLRLEDRIMSEMKRIRKRGFTRFSVARHDVLQRRLERIKATV